MSGLQEQISLLEAAIGRTTRRLENLRRRAPESPLCCHSCWLQAAFPFLYDWLCLKIQRQESWLAILKAKEMGLRPKGHRRIRHTLMCSAQTKKRWPGIGSLRDR